MTRLVTVTRTAESNADLTGFGEKGPDADTPGFDNHAIRIGACGLLSIYALCTGAPPTGLSTGSGGADNDPPRYGLYSGADRHQAL